MERVDAIIFRGNPTLRPSENEEFDTKPLKTLSANWRTPILNY